MAAGEGGHQHCCRGGSLLGCLLTSSLKFFSVWCGRNKTWSATICPTTVKKRMIGNLCNPLNISTPSNITTWRFEFSPYCPVIPPFQKGEAFRGGRGRPPPECCTASASRPAPLTARRRRRRDARGTAASTCCHPESRTQSRPSRPQTVSQQLTALKNTAFGLFGE